MRFCFFGNILILFSAYLPVFCRAFPQPGAFPQPFPEGTGDGTFASPSPSGEGWGEASASGEGWGEAPGLGRGFKYKKAPHDV